MNYSRPFLGEPVIVKIDRPLGSRHPKHGFEYPINYGFVPHTEAPDGEEIDVYVLGPDVPLESFEGRCIAIIHRLNDDDDKLVVCNDDNEFDDDEIRKLTNFQEQWFDSEIVRKSL